VPMASVTVPTPETCSVTFWMKMLVGMRRPVMLAGPAGTGKTQVCCAQTFIFTCIYVYMCIYMCICVYICIYMSVLDCLSVCLSTFSTEN
jgi:hypothetical protein